MGSFISDPECVQKNVRPDAYITHCAFCPFGQRLPAVANLCKAKLYPVDLVLNIHTEVREET